jgi:ferrous iron transport protein A
MESSLSALKIGEAAYIKDCQDKNYACKLLTLGLLPKTQVSIVRRAPIGGALYVKLNGHQIAIRKKEADAIIVEKAI